MEHKTHSEKYTCGHGHDRHLSNIVFRWPLSLLIIAGLLFLLRPFLAQQMLVRAASYFSCSSYDDAIRICKKIILIDSKNIRAWTSLGYAYKEQGNIDKAIETYERVYTLNPKDRGSAFDLGMAYFSKKEYLKALPYFERIRNDGPEKDNSLGVDILNYHRSSLTVLKECYQQLGDSVKMREIEQETKKYYPKASHAVGRTDIYGSK